jgi:hypothetical protein
MKKVVHTESGSRYLIDYDNRTWERFRGKEANKLRSDSGQFIDIGPLEIGQRFAMLCPPYHDKVGGRAIISSEITAIEDVSEC